MGAWREIFVRDAWLAPGFQTKQAEGGAQRARTCPMQAAGSSRHDEADAPIVPRGIRDAPAGTEPFPRPRRLSTRDGGGKKSRSSLICGACLSDLGAEIIVVAGRQTPSPTSPARLKTIRILGGKGQRPVSCTQQPKRWASRRAHETGRWPLGSRGEEKNMENAAGPPALAG